MVNEQKTNVSSFRTGNALTPAEIKMAARSGRAPQTGQTPQTPAEQKIANKESAEQKPKHKIDNVTFGFMVAVAIFFDVISFVPGINLLSEVFGVGTFALWWYFSGIGLINAKKLVTWATGGLIELIPAISAMPSFTAGVIITLLLTRAEEKTGISLTPGSASIKPKILPFPKKDIVNEKAA